MSTLTSRQISYVSKLTGLIWCRRVGGASGPGLVNAALGLLLSCCKLLLFGLGEVDVMASEPVPSLSASFRAHGLSNEVIHLRVDKVRRGFVKKGFFSIGALPVVRLHGVELTFESGQGVSHMDSAFTRLRSLASERSVEYHDVRVGCQRDPFFRIEAERLDRVSDHSLIFSGKTRLILAASTNEFDRAEFRFSDRGLTVDGGTRDSGTNRVDIPISP